MPRTPLRALLSGAAVAAAYVIAARFGFEVAFVAEQVTTVWAPTGIAIATLLLGGLGWWPAIWAGAFLANAGTTAPLWTAVTIATGNTVEAGAAAWLLRRIARFDDALRRASDVLVFGAVAVLLCTAISATIGVTSLTAAGVQPWTRFATIWFDWWLGDALGALIVAPAILTTVHKQWSRRDVRRAAFFAAGSALVAHLVFGQAAGVTTHPLEYVVFPLVIATAVRLGPAPTTLVVLVTSAVAISHTLRGLGPFAGPETHHSLVLLQVFLGVLAGTALLLAAAILERKTSERGERAAAAVLREREEMLMLAQRAGGVGVFDWDVERHVAHGSAEFFRIFGLPAHAGTMSTEQWWQHVHPEDRDRMARQLEHAVDEPATGDYRIQAADGTMRWLTYAGQVQGAPHRRRFIGTVVDVTDRKRLEADLRQRAAELAESRDVLALAMRGGSMGAWSRNLETNDVWWSRELEEIVGLEPGAFARTEAGYFEFVHPDDRATVRRVVDDAVANGLDYTTEFRFRHSSGEWRWMEGRGRAVYAGDGTPRMLYGIGIDITDRKRAELALRDAKVAAESANQLKDQFLATLSHELRTPLNVILGYARMLQGNSIPADKQPRAFDVIERNAVAQNQLIEDLLDMSRITAGKIRLDPQPMPVATVLGEAVDSVKPAADAKGVAMAIDVDPFAGTVMADPGRLQQVFANLLTNAIKFTRSGDRVEVSLLRDDAAVEIRIRDTGLGISPEFLPFVFEPFRQADGRFARGHGGLGLGLAISRQLAELHGGTIEASSAGVGHGATFTVRLPRESAGDARIVGRDTRNDAALDEASPTPDALAGVEILLVEDAPDTLMMFREALAGAGAKVHAVASAADALQATGKWRPDLLVTDLGLPGMDGYELLREMRAREAGNGFPAVAVSAYAGHDDRARAIAAGFRMHLAKPIDPSRLVKALTAALSSPD